VDYRVTGGPRGRKVEFVCPRCTFALESPLEEAGNTYACPTCGHSVLVPGIDELRQFRLDEARKADTAAREEAKRRAQERDRLEQRAREGEDREAAALEAERAKAAKRAEREANRRGVTAGPFAGSLLAVILLTLAVAHFALVRPLQLKLSGTQVELSNTEVELSHTQARLADVTVSVESLLKTVNHNAAAANATAVGMESLTRTVNHNADAAHKATATLANALAETDRLARNANDHAHSHSRY
jgi:DNA-directed RNA polymerase subunit RPC12/RpoP